MNYYKTFNTIKEEGFDEELALLTTVAHAIHHCMQVEESDMKIEGRFKLRMEELIQSTLWEHNARIEEVITLESTLSDYGMGANLKGLGGCKKKILKDLYEKTWIAKRKPIQEPPREERDPIVYPPMDTEVIINLNDDAGVVQYSVAYLHDPENWINSYLTYKEAAAMVNSREYTYNPKTNFSNSLSQLEDLVISAAIRYKGELYIGNSHSEIGGEMLEKGVCPAPYPGGDAQGFINGFGEFISREEAMEVAIKSKQVRPGHTFQPFKLFSEDL